MQKIEKKPAQTIKKGGGKINRVPPGMAAPHFNSLLAAHAEGDSPIAGLPPTGDPETDVEQELSAALLAIKKARSEQRDAFRAMTDPNFYLVVCFQSTDQRDEFVKLAGWKPNGAFVDGLSVARLIGVDVTPINLPRKQNRAMPVALRGQKIIGNSE